jgi:4-hydroxyproline epimerase
MKIDVIDSHTEGEPTRVVVAGGPDLGSGPLLSRRERFRQQYDQFRSAIVTEPRASDAVVGALLCSPYHSFCTAGVIFFNNVGYLNMCGHGMIGLVATLAYLGRIRPGLHNIDTPVGVVTAHLHSNASITIRNVPSYRLSKGVALRSDTIGTVTGDIAWGGNWFFLVPESPIALELRNLDELSNYTWQLRETLRSQGITGANGEEIDHIELFGPPKRSDADARNFVLCPGRAYDRSPCGTGTSAKLACLYADGALAEGQTWRQESIIGSLFEGHVEIHDGQVFPLITGTAHVTSEARLVLDERDPFRWGIPA